MARRLPEKSLTAAPYIPTSARTGGEGATVFRMQNVFLRGSNENNYSEVYGGNAVTDGVIASGILTSTADYITVAPATLSLMAGGIGSLLGTGTRFRKELRAGQWIEIKSIASPITRTITTVDEIRSDINLSFSRAAANTAFDNAVITCPRIFPMNTQRGTLISGNAILLDNGNILCVGSGVLRLNGSVLASTMLHGLTARRRAQIAILNPSTSTYSIYRLGMAVPTTLTATADAGSGTKNMQAGIYSYFVVPMRRETGGYNNPSPKAEVTLATGDRVKLTIPAADTTDGQNQWGIFGSLYTEIGGINGPWYFVKAIDTPGDVATAGGDYIFEYNDAEVSQNDLLTFDNDPPPDAEYIASVAGYPIYVSCEGPGYAVGITVATNANPVVFTTSPAHDFVNGQDVIIAGATGGWTAVNGTFPVTVVSATTFSIPVDSTAFGALSGTLTATTQSSSPGPFIVPAKPNNIEAAPLKWAVAPSPAENIIGFIEALGRLYLMTANTLQVAQFVPTDDPDIPPVIIRPFWKAGFNNPNQLCVVDETLYGYTSQGPTRSTANGDVTEEQHIWANPVKEIISQWSRGNVSVAHDPFNNVVCYFHSANGFNASSNFLNTRVLVWGLERQAWIGDILISSPTTDMVVTGVATVNGRLEFIAGGWNDSANVYSTYRFDEMSTSPIAVPWYMAWQFTDDNSELIAKEINALRTTGKLTSATIGIHGASVGEVINVTTLEAGNGGSKSGSKSLPTTTDITLYERLPLNVPDLSVWTVRIDGTWAGSGMKDRVDEIVVERSLRGVRR